MNLRKLTETLRLNGYLGDAEVSGVELTPKTTIGLGSKFFDARLSYSSSDHDLPTQMVVKQSSIHDRGDSEAQLYKLAKAQPELPLTPCYGIVDEGVNKPMSFLFADLTQSHYQTEWPLAPGYDDCVKAVRCLAQFHANWWNKADQLNVPDLSKQTQDFEMLGTRLGEFLDFTAETLSPQRQRLYERVVSDLGSILEKRLGKGRKTLIHSDAHFWNFLFPVDATDVCRLFDWPLWRTGLGGNDLAYMLALHLYPEHRSRFEAKLLEEYRLELQHHGVIESQQDLLHDYRIGVMNGLLMPVLEFVWNIPCFDWLPKLEKAWGAFDDLDCQNLLTS